MCMSDHSSNSFITDCVLQCKMATPFGVGKVHRKVHRKDGSPSVVDARSTLEAGRGLRATAPVIAWMTHRFIDFGKPYTASRPYVT